VYPEDLEITVNLPDEFAGRLLHEAPEPSRARLKSAAAEAHREGRMTGFELRTLLRMTQFDLDGFLKTRGIYPAHR
jgi:hypothetical protein